MRTVIFDLDGTLADTSGDLIVAANSAMIQMGMLPQLHRGQDDATAFRGGRAMLTLSLERAGHDDIEAAVEVGYPILLEAYADALDTHTELYPGVVPAIEAVRAAGFRTGICTNKPEAMAVELVAKLGISHLFGTLIGADTLPVRKPDPVPLIVAVEQVGGDISQSVLIGDTITDRETSRAAGALSALVTFGPLGLGVADMKPDALLHDYRDLLGLCENLLPAVRG